LSKSTPPNLQYNYAYSYGSAYNTVKIKSTTVDTIIISLRKDLADTRISQLLFSEIVEHIKLLENYAKVFRKHQSDITVFSTIPLTKLFKIHKKGCSCNEAESNLLQYFARMEMNLW
jgi:hypothetical protein